MIHLDRPIEDLKDLSEKRCLALNSDEMQFLENLFQKKDVEQRKSKVYSDPTDVEIEIPAQSWSEHCKYKIFKAAIHYEEDYEEKEFLKEAYKNWLIKG